MKSNSQFLTEMWSKVNEKEREQLEMQTAVRESTQLVRRNIILYLVVLAVCAAAVALGILLRSTRLDGTYIIAVVMVVAGFVADDLYFRKNRRAKIK